VKQESLAAAGPGRACSLHQLPAPSHKRITGRQVLEENQNLMNVIGMRVFPGDRVLEYIEGVLDTLITFYIDC
jgi:hypothetical protein